MGVKTVSLVLVLAAETALANNCKASTEWSQEVREATRIACARLFDRQTKLGDAEFRQAYHECKEGRDAFENAIRDMGRTCRGPNETSLFYARNLQSLDRGLVQHTARYNFKARPQNVAGLKSENK